MGRPARKAEFVKQHMHQETPEIIEAASKAGISLSKSYVSKLRAEAPRVSKPIARVARVKLAAVESDDTLETQRVTPMQSTHRHEFTAFSKMVWRLGTVQLAEWLAAIDQGARAS